MSPRQCGVVYESRACVWHPHHESNTNNDIPCFKIWQFVVHIVSWMRTFKMVRKVVIGPWGRTHSLAYANQLAIVTTLHSDLVKLLSHLANDVSMFHVVIHVWRYSTSTTWAVDEELYKLKQCGISILLVGLNPLINDGLQRQKSCTMYTSHSLIVLRWRDKLYRRHFISAKWDRVTVNISWRTLFARLVCLLFNGT